MYAVALGLRGKTMNLIKQKLTELDPDLLFAVILSLCVFSFFAFSNPLFFTLNAGFSIMERFAVLGLVGLALTLCIIAGEIDLSIGSNAALSAVIVVRLTDSMGAFPAIGIGVLCATLIGLTQGYLLSLIHI